MSRATPEPIEAYDAWQNGNSIQRLARQVIPAPLLEGAPYGHIDVLNAIRRGSDAVGAAGPELVTDGDMSNALSWTLGAGWTIAAGLASCSGAAAAVMSQALTLTQGDEYIVRWDTLNGTYGAGVTVSLGGTSPPFGATIEDGEHGVLIIAGAGSLIEFTNTGLNDFIGDVDNVSVRKVG